MDQAAWQRIVENSTPAVWEVEVRDEDDAVRRVEVPFIETIETAGLLVGSSPACHVELDDESIPDYHARIQAASNHQFVEVLAGTIGHTARERRIEPGKPVRFDHMPLFFGGFEVSVSISSP